MSACHQPSTIRHFLIGLVVTVVAGCSEPDVPIPMTGPLPTPDEQTLADVKRVIAEFYDVNLSDMSLFVSDSTAVQEIRDDELDVLEIVMDVDDHFDVWITEKVLMRVTGEDDIDEARSSLTVYELAQAVTLCRNAKP